LQAKIAERKIGYAFQLAPKVQDLKLKSANIIKMIFTLASVEISQRSADGMPTPWREC
jgi:hypothetical protein